MAESLRAKVTPPLLCLWEGRRLCQVPRAPPSLLAQRAASPGEQRRGSHEGLEGHFGGLWGQGVGGHELLLGSACRLGSQEQLRLGDGGQDLSLKGSPSR